MLAFRCGIALFLLALGASAIAAQTQPDTLPADTGIVSLEGLTVTGVRTATAVGGASVLVMRPDSLLLPPAASLAELLRELPFVLVRENSRGEAELSIRGSESRQTAVLLDGIPLTLGWDGRTDPSLVPLTGARRVRLVRGLGSLLNGPNVLGGAVEVDLAAGSDAGVWAPGAALRAGVDQAGGRSTEAVGNGSRSAGRGELGLTPVAASAPAPG